MNPTDAQSLMNQLAQQAQQQTQHLIWAYLAFTLAALLVTAFVIYIFYARLRGIEDELRKLRIAYEFVHTPETRSRTSEQTQSHTAISQAADAKYMPKG